MIQNTNDFEIEYGNALNNAIDYVMNKILNEYKDIIDTVVYSSYSPLMYERTYDFKESWQTDVKKSRNESEGLLEQNTSLMTVNPDKFQHSAPNVGDLRNQIADMIFNGYGYTFKGVFEVKRDAWTPLLKLIDNKLDNWFVEGMSLQGLDVKKNVAGGQVKNW